MLTRATPTSPSSSHDEVGHVSQSILNRARMHRFAPAKGFSSRTCIVRIDRTGMHRPERCGMVAHRSVRSISPS
jgi:hypothetical protein